MRNLISVPRRSVRPVCLSLLLAGLASLAACGGNGGSPSTAGSAGSSSGSSSASSASSSSSGASATSSLLLTHAGRWLTDSQGRVVVIHGMNYVKKSPTTLPDGSQTLDPAADGFGAKDLQWLEDNGFNGLRLGLEDYGLELQPGVYDDAYVGQIAAMASLAVTYDIFPLIDFHQDDYSPYFGGDGFPSWMVQDDGLPQEPNPGFPSSQFVEPALLSAWDHFWANAAASDGIGLQDHFAAAAAHAAVTLASIDGLLGYEYLNEPWPGTQWPTCVVPEVGCPLFDATLTTFNRAVAPGIRAADAQHLIFAEPNVIFNDGIPTDVGALNVANAGFAFHVYCLLAGADGDSESPGGAQVCPTLEELAFDNADSHVAQTQEALLMTEFGATPDTTVISRNTVDADAHMDSWMWWAYDEGTGLDPAQNPPDQNLIPAVADLLVRAYPRAIAGTPSSWSFDPVGHVFQLTYSTQRADGTGAFAAGGVTEIFLPPRHYPNGYQVSVTGGTVQSAPAAALLLVTAQPDAQSVQVTVMPPA